jgi:two-component sensor histidine kinase
MGQPTLSSENVAESDRHSMYSVSDRSPRFEGANMMETLPFASETNGESLLHIAELIHRIRNEYTRAISLASLMASRASCQETKGVLCEMINHLHSLAEAHGVLRPPLEEGAVDLSEKLALLCRALARSTEFERRGITLLLSFEGPVLISTGRSWRAGLIVSELINNACRHAFGSRTGHISVTVATTCERILCIVSDDGSSTSKIEPGLGTRLVDALAVELNGFVERRFSEHGSTVTLSLPKEAVDVALLHDGWGVIRKTRQ